MCSNEMLKFTKNKSFIQNILKVCRVLNSLSADERSIRNDMGKTPYCSVCHASQLGSGQIAYTLYIAFQCMNENLHIEQQLALVISSRNQL